jgi:hypothetical protein
MEQSNIRVPAVQPPRSEGISRRAILIIALLVGIFYVANWISTRPLTRQSRFIVTPTPTITYRTPPASSGAPAEDAPGVRWCTDYGGVFERFSPFIEICYFPPLQN